MTKSKQQDVALNHRLAAIGFRIHFSEPDFKLKDLTLLEEADIEETLIRAAYEARVDFRILSILLTWITVHADYVIVEKFAKKRLAFEKPLGMNRVLDLMAAQAVASGSHKWKKLLRTSPRRPEIPVDPELLEASIQYQGADEQLKKHGILVPKKLLRIREEDVLTSTELSRLNSQYRNRLLYGASWRADIIAAIEAGVKNANQISRLLGCSYEPAYRVFRDYRVALGVAA
jgi:hypothetical protein